MKRFIGFATRGADMGTMRVDMAAGAVSARSGGNAPERNVRAHCVSTLAVGTLLRTRCAAACSAALWGLGANPVPEDAIYSVTRQCAVTEFIL